MNYRKKYYKYKNKYLNLKNQYGGIPNEKRELIKTKYPAIISNQMLNFIDKYEKNGYSVEIMLKLNKIMARNHRGEVEYFEYKPYDYSSIPQMTI